MGVRERPHPRNAPTVLNTGLNFIIHWRGDRDSLEDQVIKALTSPITSSQPDERAVLDRLEQIPGYSPLFKAAFPDDPLPMTGKNIAKAIGAFERTLVTPAPFDRYLGGDVEALSPKARAGLGTFMNTGCVTCHNGVLVGGGMYRKFGVVEDYWNATGSKVIDKGRADVTKDPSDLYLFRVASLRNVAMTAPYFHDGSVATLPEAEGSWLACNSGQPSTIPKRARSSLLTGEVLRRCRPFRRDRRILSARLRRSLTVECDGVHIPTRTRGHSL
jgi:cytochrome c peroxidase